MLEVENLTKAYNGFRALDGLNLRVAQGEIYGFLGPNGAGKTTTILMLLDVLKPTSGRIRFWGQELTGNSVNIRRRVGVVSEKQYLYKEMTAKEYLDFFGDLYQVAHKSSRLDELLEELDLRDVRHRRLGAFSRGMQQKISFARALLHDPEFLILDEPISGLDPQGVKKIRDLIARENQKGKTVFISSHLLSEVEKLCQKVGIIHKGRLLAEERMENLKRRLSAIVELEVELERVTPAILQALSSFPFIEEVKNDRNYLAVKVKSDKDYRAEISRALSQQGALILGIKRKEMSLEEAFMTITTQNISLLAGAEKEQQSRGNE
ncbi:MAG: ABC transporter ATP-binding protein [Desulfobacterales bacterium]|nr:MAG: ABC transporter ATP-binding protein [Desulfobacterales bacterium]